MNKINNRYVILAFTLLMMLPSSFAYVWSIIQPYAMDHFAIGITYGSIPVLLNMAVFPIGNILAGILQQRFSLQKVLLAASLVAILSVFSVSLMQPHQPLLMVLFYGLIFGLCSGIIYNSMIVTAQKWFPGQLGLITGVMLCMIGISGFLMSPLSSFLLGRLGFSRGFAALSGVMALTYLPSAFIVRAPSEQQEGITRAANATAKSKEYTIGDVLRSKSYYLLAGSFMLAVSAFMFINPLFVILGMERTLTHQQAVTGVMLGSISQTVGRLVVPLASDRFPQELVLLGNYLLCALSVIAAAFTGGLLFGLFYIVIAFSYGGFMGLFPAVSTRYYGRKNAGSNYGLILLGFSMAAIATPFISRAVQATQTGITLSFIIAGGACLVGMVLTLTLFKDARLSNNHHSTV